MRSSDIPTKMPIPFARDAGTGYIEPVPQLASPTPGKASYATGFPPPNFQQIAGGGVPPYGADMNGLMSDVTKWLRWAQAGGAPAQWDSAFGAAVGGYPKGALVASTGALTYGKLWLSVTENNTTNPDAGGVGWVPFPDVLIQLQANNYAQDTGTVNQVKIALGRAPASWTEIVGTPIRFKIGNANTVNNPTITINTLTPAVIVNPDGTVLGIGQMTLGAIAEGFPRDDGNFQLNSPAKQYSPSGTFPIPGFIMPWATETPPSGFLECDGRSLLISSYPNLWAVLNTRYGGDGVNTFRLPDYRGEFLRGWDHGRGLDMGASSRTNAGGGITGDHVGTNEQSSVRSADLGGTITINNPTIGTGASNRLIGQGGQDQPYWSFGDGGIGALSPLSGPFTVAGGGIETRPVNINVMWVIFTG